MPFAYTLGVMKIDDLPPDLKFPLLALTAEGRDFSFMVKKQALGAHIAHRWGWNEEFQREVHDQRLREKPFYLIELKSIPIGTLSLREQPNHLRFGEFYLIDAFRGQGIGSQILTHCLGIAEKMNLAVRLEYLRWNPVGSLYRRNGFVEVDQSSTHFFMERPARLEINE